MYTVEAFAWFMKYCMNYVPCNLFLTSPFLENLMKMEMQLQLKYLPQISTFCDVLIVQFYCYLNFDYGLKHNDAALKWCNLSWHMISDEILQQLEVEVAQYHTQLSWQQLHGSITPASSKLLGIKRDGSICIHRIFRMKHKMMMIISCNTLKILRKRNTKVCNSH